MSEIVVAFGLVLVIEGVLWALLPGMAQGLLRAAAETPEAVLRAAGAAAVAAGVALVWIIKG